jgi:hypothetical protein
MIPRNALTRPGRTAAAGMPLEVKRARKCWLGRRMDLPNYAQAAAAARVRRTTSQKEAARRPGATISRVLSARAFRVERAGRDDHLSGGARRNARCLPPIKAGCDYYPEGAVHCWPAGQATRLLFCLAPHGVFRAPRFAPRAVSSCLAFSPLPGPARKPGKPGRFIFCDTFRCRRLSPPAPACCPRHDALWCSDFPLAGRASGQAHASASDRLSLQGQG